ncbi:MAG: hypothetical protein ABJA70_02430 [Chryseolinea sp.]
MKKYNNTNILLNIPALIGISFLILLSTSCDDNSPVKEDTPELITRATLTFTPAGGGTAIVVTATDPDGEGVQNIAVDGPINLAIDKSYILAIALINGLADPASAAYDITSEVKQESQEHQFYFSWTNNVFSNPAGDGNVDNRSDAIGYDDKDVNNLPIGLETTWTTSTSAASGKFKVLLKHQPDLKSAISTSADGESDLDVEFVLNVE